MLYSGFPFGRLQRGSLCHETEALSALDHKMEGLATRFFSILKLQPIVILFSSKDKCITDNIQQHIWISNTFILNEKS